MTLKTYLAGVAIAALTFAAGAASAAVTQVADQAAFSAAGTIDQNTNFDTAAAGFSYPGDVFTVGDLTFVAGGQSLIGEVGGSYNTARPLLTDNFIAGTTIQIAGLHDLFAFNLGNFFQGGEALLTVTTNLGSYQFNPFVGTAVNQGALTFVGFKADAGEHFTSVRYAGNGATGATDIQLGTAGAVPEPATWALMIGGFGMAGATLRRRRAALA